MIRIMSARSVSADGRSRIGDYLRTAVVDERDGPLPALLLTLTVLVGIVDATSILLAHVFVATPRPCAGSLLSLLF